MLIDRFCRVLLAALAAASLDCVLPSLAQALTACSAAEIVAQDVGCPDSDAACTISLDFDLGSSCVLDFGARDVVIASVLRSPSGTLTITAGSVTIGGTGCIDVSGDAGGGRVTLTTQRE